MSAEVVYRGRHTDTAGEGPVEIVEAGEVVGVLRHVPLHSPTGFSWGYLGSGPADLARSLLIAVLGERAATCPECAGTRRVVAAGDRDRPFDPDRDPGELAMSCWVCPDGYRALPYQDFKAEFVARWGDEWTISRSEIEAWLAANAVQR